MNNFSLSKALPVAALALTISAPIEAAITLYDKNDATVKVDASFNAFYVNSDIENGPNGDRKQSRVKMGFLPNWLGLDFSKKLNNVTVGGRSSFWVTINDSQDTGTATDSAIDVRQFYGTIDGSWGQVLFGKDFTLFNRSNIFNDEILLGYGQTSDSLGLVDGGGVSFGNIGSGYIYPLPTSQITYRTPEKNGFKFAIGIFDPADTSTPFNGGARGEENSPRFESELTFSKGAFNAWIGGLYQKSEGAAGVDIDSTGVSYGLTLKSKNTGLGLHLSGFQSEGAGLLIGPADVSALGANAFVFDGTDEVEVDGYLAQLSFAKAKERFVLSYGKTELEVAGGTNLESETKVAAWFHKFNKNLTGVAEYIRHENTFQGAGTEEKVDTIALGLVASF